MSSNTSFGGRFCIVQSILSHRYNERGDSEFLVKWKSASQLKATWEPLENLIMAQDLIENYYAQRYKKAANWKLYTEPDEVDLGQSVKQEKLNINKNTSQKPSLQICYDQILQTPKKLKPMHRMKFTAPKKIVEKKQLIDWKEIKQIEEIRRNLQTSQWQVLVKWHCHQKQPIWVDRQIVRIVCPYVLMEFYFRKERQKVYSKSQQNDTLSRRSFSRKSQSYQPIEIQEEQWIQLSTDSNIEKMEKENENQQHSEKP